MSSSSGIPCTDLMLVFRSPMHCDNLCRMVSRSPHKIQMTPMRLDQSTSMAMVLALVAAHDFPKMANTIIPTTIITMEKHQRPQYLPSNVSRMLMTFLYWLEP